jgi:alpha-D-ribose 1-methylphosphonate 5-triphosphate diphosphatase PhnM
VALVLSRKYEWTYEQINDFFAETQAVWQEYSDSKMDMVQACLEETGIELRSKRL